MRCVAGMIVIVGCLGAGGCGSTQSRAGGRVDYASKTANLATTERGEAAVLATCPLGMVLIPSGPARYGPPEEKNVRPGDKEQAQQINMKAFCIDKYEYPNEPGEAPMRSVTWMEAKDLCSNRGKRLCTEYEFEKACRGPVGTLYTYGDGYAENACASPAAEYGLGQFSNCISGFGVHDMGGGVFEWTSSVAPNAVEGKNDIRILKGGMSADSKETSSRCTYRARYAASSTGREIGFRCCAVVVKEEINERR